MSETNQKMTASRDSRPHPARWEWPEKRFYPVYAVVLIYTIVLIFLLWAFSRVFD